MPTNNHNMEDVFGRQGGSTIAQPKGQRVIKTNQRGFSQPPNHIFTTQTFHLVTTTTNEHHPHLEETNNKQNPRINPYQPLFLPTMPRPLQ
jgi:hypothetical protein